MSVRASPSPQSPAHRPVVVHVQRGLVGIAHLADGAPIPPRDTFDPYGEFGFATYDGPRLISVRWNKPWPPVAHLVEHQTEHPESVPEEFRVPLVDWERAE